MYSRQHRISKKPANPHFAPPENRFAPQTDFAQTKPEQETQSVSPEEVEKIKASGSNWPDVSIFTTNRPAPAPRPRIQMKLNLPQQEKQPEEKTEDNTIDDEKIDLLSDEQTSTETSAPTSAPEIQTKLNISEAGDKYEQEADQATDKVVNQISTTQNPSVQREEQTETAKLPAKSISENIKNHANSKTNKLSFKKITNSIANKDLSDSNKIKLKSTNNNFKSKEEEFQKQLKQWAQFWAIAGNIAINKFKAKIQEWRAFIKQFQQFVSKEIFKPTIDKIEHAIKVIQKKLEEERLRREQQTLEFLQKLEKLNQADFDQYMTKMTQSDTSELLFNFSYVRKSEALKYKDLIQRIKTARVIKTGESMVGTLKWRGGSEPDPKDNYRIKKTTYSWEKQNDFAVWINGGSEPTSDSTMNCWEGVLFIAYKAGVVTENWLKEVHNQAAKAGKDKNSSQAYYNVLKQKLNYNISKPLPFDFKNNRRIGDIPAGNIIFINELNHVVISKGTKEQKTGHHEVLSLWIYPEHQPSSLPLSTIYSYGRLQDTTLEKVSKPVEEVTYAPAPW